MNSKISDESLDQLKDKLVKDKLVKDKLEGCNT
jgi:hypothetical protein